MTSRLISDPGSILSSAAEPVSDDARASSLAIKFEKTTSNCQSDSDLIETFISFMQSEVWGQSAAEFLDSVKADRSQEKKKSTLDFLTHLTPSFQEAIFKNFVQNAASYRNARQLSFVSPFLIRALDFLKAVLQPRDDMTFKNAVDLWTLLVRLRAQNNAYFDSNAELKSYYAQCLKAIIRNASSLEQLRDFFSQTVTTNGNPREFRIRFKYSPFVDDKVDEIDPMKFWQDFFENSKLKDIPFEELLALNAMLSTGGAVDLQILDYSMVIVNPSSSSHQIDRAKTFLLWVYSRPFIQEDSKWVFPRFWAIYLNDSLPRDARLVDSLFSTALPHGRLEKRMLARMILGSKATNRVSKLYHRACEFFLLQSSTTQ
jgi:hypothetical protein